MSNLEEYSNKIHEEVTAVLSRVDPEQVENALDLIQKTRKIALYAGGREGLRCVLWRCVYSIWVTM